VSKTRNLTGSYRISPVFIPAENTELEPNNSWEQAQNIKPGDLTVGYISYQDSSDFYKVVTAQAGQHTLRVTPGANDALALEGASIHWYDSAGVQTETPFASSSFYFASGDIYSNSINLEAGNYYFQVSKYNDYTGTYELTSAFAAARNTEREPNNRWEQAQEIKTGDSVIGFISLQDDDDYYKATLAQAGKLTLRVTAGANDAAALDGASINWYDSTGVSKGTPFASSSFYLSKGHSYDSSINLEAGTYYFRVSKFINYTGTYNLTKTSS
jgi:uncharacterized protein YcfL